MNGDTRFRKKKGKNELYNVFFVNKLTLFL